MIDFLYKKMLKIIFTFIMFLLGLNFVQAYKFDEIKNKDGLNMYINCNSDNGCLPICTYETTFGSGAHYGIIGNYYAGTDELKLWEIGYTHESQTYYIYTFSKYMPITNIYKGGEPGDWKGSDLYNNLQNKYECPKYFNASSTGDRTAGFCFSSNDSDCVQDHSYLKATLINDYSFADEYTSIATTVYEAQKLYLKNNSGGSSNVKNESDNDKIKFLSDFDRRNGGESNIKYDPSLSPESNAKQNCEYIKSFAMGKDFIASYISPVMLTNDKISKYYKDYLDAALQREADNRVVKFPEVYTHSNLEKMMVKSYKKDANGNDTIIYKEIGMIDGKAVWERLNNLYGENVVVSTKYIADVCGFSLNTDTDGDGEVDEDTTFYDLEQEVGNIVKTFNYPKIDFERTDYDCGFLSDFADIIQKGYFAIEMIGLVIVVALSIMDYVKVFLNDDADGVKKANGHLMKRLIFVVILFLLPGVINFALRLFHVEGIDSDNPLCVEISNK